MKRWEQAVYITIVAATEDEAIEVFGHLDELLLGPSTQVVHVDRQGDLMIEVEE